MKFLIVAVVSFLFSGCAYSVHQYHVSDYDLEESIVFSKASKVESKTEQFVVLGFVNDTDFADEAWTGLQSQCPTGKILGVNTRHSTDLGFFSWTNRVIMKGYCVQ